MDTPDRLRLATRLHFALRRHLGHEVPVECLLSGDREAREALWVCEAADDDELRRLARALRRVEAQAAAAAKRPVAAPQPVAAAPQEAAWARDTSGFGLSAPMPLERSEAPAATASAGSGRSWLRPSRWLRRPGDDRR